MPPKPSYQEIPIDSVEYDFKNPRLTGLLGAFPDLTPELVYSALRPAEDGFFTLQNSIRTNGGIINPIKVNEGADGKRVVFEGNTRLAIYKNFFDKEVPGGDWAQIPAFVYSDLSNKEIDIVRLQDHLIGPRQWNPYAKAKYLYYLSTEEKIPLEDLVSFVGGQKTNTVYMMKAYREMEDSYRGFLRESPDYDEKEDFFKDKFSGYLEFVKRPDLISQMKSLGYTEKSFAEWMAEEKFDNLQHVRKLKEILKNDSARETFLEEGSNEALKYLTAPNIREILDKLDLDTLCAATSARINELTLKEMGMIKNDPERLNPLKDLYGELENLHQNFLSESS